MSIEAATTVMRRTEWRDEVWRSAYCSMPSEAISIENRHLFTPALAYAFAISLELFSTVHHPVAAMISRGSGESDTSDGRVTPLRQEGDDEAAKPYPSPMKHMGRLLKPFCTLTIASAKRVASSVARVVPCDVLAEHA